MNAGAGLVEHLVAEHAAQAARLPGAGAGWLARLREQGIARFAEVGLPDQRSEEWRYTRLAGLARRELSIAQGAGTGAADGAERLVVAGAAARLAFVDGLPCPRLSSLDALPAGVELTELGAALEAGDPRLAQELGAVADADRHGFAALSAAFAARGALLRVAEGARIEAPIQLLFVATAGAADRALQPRVVVSLGRDSRALLVETHAGLTERAYLANVVTEVALAEGASLEHVRVQAESAGAYHVGAIEVVQGARSHFTSRLFSLGALLARHDLIVRLEGEGAHCALDGLYCASGKAHVDCHTRIEHLVPGCTSREDYRGVLDGRARGVFDGRITVHPDAQGSDARQSNANLLLSRTAEADTKPQLVIHADDVKCAHGATVGELDPAMVFYLRSRGIDEALARAMLTVGFARELLERITDAGARARVADAVAAALPGAATTRGMLE